MSKTIAVVRGEKDGEWKVLVNYVQRGITLHDMNFANNMAMRIAENEHYDHLILAKEEA